MHKGGKVVTREWRKANVLNWNLHSFQLLEIIQVLDSISWVRCASGNVFRLPGNSSSCLETFQFFWKLSRLSENFSDCLETFWKLSIHSLEKNAI